MSTLHEQMDLAALLALIVTNTGRLVGRLRIQKLMYLLQKKGAKSLQPFFFEYHHYGPYSAEVADVIKGAVRSKILTEHEDSDDGGWKRFEYRPDLRASMYADRVDLDTRALVDQVLNVCGQAEWRALELAATVDFLRREENLKREASLREALERKPQCAPYVPQAQKILDMLQL